MPPPGQEAVIRELATLGVLTLVEPLDALARLFVTSALGVILVELAVGLGSVLGIGGSDRAGSD